ncbi:MAG: HDOD domain-containing protein [Candidatus Hydrogenedentes bacterium]|nr:HDOD domain-containing protein [Candidatus Hydrogenedentota bacterium]
MSLECLFCHSELTISQKPRKWSLHICSNCNNPLWSFTEGSKVILNPIPNYPDIRSLLHKGSIGAEIFSLLPSFIDSIPVMPQVSYRVIQLLQNPEVSLSDVVEVIKGDHGLAMTVLKVANSAYYAGLQEVKDLTTACSRLGLRTLANVVQLYTMQNVFKAEDEQLTNLLERLWKHSIATAHASNDLATAVAQSRPEELFLAGLLHDIGYIALLQILYQVNSSSFTQIISSDQLTYEVLLQFHTLVSLYIFDKWELPDEFALLAFSHHDPNLIPIDELKTPAHILCLANLLAIKEGYTFLTKGEDILFLQHPSTHYLNLNDLKIASLRVDLTDKLQSIFSVFQV